MVMRPLGPRCRTYISGSSLNEYSIPFTDGGRAIIDNLTTYGRHCCGVRAYVRNLT